MTDTARKYLLRFHRDQARFMDRQARDLDRSPAEDQVERVDNQRRAESLRQRAAWHREAADELENFIELHGIA